MNGILILNKEKGETSHDFVSKIKKITHEKVGHTGTLDPMAEGVLPLLIGKATKLSKYLVEHDKEYEVVLQLGKRTSTADSEGEVIEEKEVMQQKLSKEKIEAILSTFLGKQKQTPPVYSAIKINGKKLYEYAREGKQVEIPERQIEIFAISLKNVNVAEKNISFWVHCSKGTYMRSLCEDIAKKLQTVGYMKELKRTRVGNFSIENAITYAQIKETPKMVEEHTISMEQFFKEKQEIILNEKQLSLFLNGVLLNFQKQDEIYCIYDISHHFIGIGVCKNQKLKRDIII